MKEISAAHRQLGQVFRRIRTARGVSARQVRKPHTADEYFSAGHIHLVESGRATPSPFLIQAYEELAGDDTRLRALYTKALAIALERRQHRRGLRMPSMLSVRQSVDESVPYEYEVVGRSIIAGMPVWHVASNSSLEEESASSRFDASYVPALTDTEIVVYLDKYEETHLREIQAVALRLASDLGYDDFRLLEEQIGSIFRRFIGKLRDGLGSDFVARRMEEIEERISTETIGKVRAETDAITTSNAVSLIAALADVPNAVIRVGGILIIKKTDMAGNPFVLVRQLTGQEVRALELNPGIQKDPQSALYLLALAVAELDKDSDEFESNSNEQGPRAR